MKRLAATMTVSCKRFRTQALAAWMCAALTVAAFADDSAAHTDEALAIDVPAGQTVTYSGVLSGTTSIAKTGKGTLVLNNGANSFTGGITISAGIVKVTAAGALGADANAISIAGSTSQANQLEFAAAGATFANPITVTAAGNSTYTVMRFTADTTLTGTITGTAAGFQHRVDEGVTVTFDGAMNASGKDIIAYVWGDATYNGKVTCNRFNTAGSSPYPNTGRVFFGPAGHSVGTLQISRLLAVKGTADNALPCANVQHKVTEANIPSQGVMDLGGHSQKVNRLGWAASYMTAANTGCLIRSPDGKASLTITTGSNDKTFACLMDDIDLIIDFANASNVQTFSNRLHQTCGDIEVKKGIMRMQGTGAFQNVTNVTVSGGTLDVQSTTFQAFASATNITVSSGSFLLSDATPNPLTDGVCTLTLGRDATLRVPTGMTLRVKDFVFDGSPMSKGTHSAATDAELDGHLTGGGEIYVIGSAEPVSDTWTGGGGADTALATAANWAGNASPDLESGLFSPTFASGGTSATVSGAVTFGNVTLSGATAGSDNGFTVSAADNAATITVHGELAIDEDASQAGYANTFTFQPPVLIENASAITFAVPTNDILAFAGGLATSTDVILDGTGGTLALDGVSTVPGMLSVAAGTLALSGTLGPVGSTLSVPAKTAPLAYLRMEGATVQSDFTLTAASGDRANTWLSFAEGTTNEFAGAITASPSWNVTVGGSTLTFSGGVDISGKLLLMGDGTMFVRGRPLTILGSSNYLTTREHGAGLKVVWEVASNSVPELRIDTDTSGCTFEYRTNDVFAGNADAVLNQSQGRGVHDFGSTTQRFANVFGNNGTLTGAYPSALVVTRGVDGSELSTVNLTCSLSGGLGLVMAGDRSFCLNAPVSSVTTCGDLAVEAGVFEIAARSGWMHGTNVFVNGGVLKINTDHAFDKAFAQVHFSGDGKIEVPAGVCQKFMAGWNGGVRMQSGVTYTAANLPERVSGAGSIRIVRSGTMIAFH